MTTPNPQAVVEALELAAKHETQSSYIETAWLRKQAEKALPLARQMAKEWDEIVRDMRGGG